MRRHKLTPALLTLLLCARMVLAANAGDVVRFTGPDELDLPSIKIGGIPVSTTAVFTGYSPVRMTTTASITLSGTQTIDGISGVAGDRVLVKGQTPASTNGIYIMAIGAWTRASDMDASAGFVPFPIWVMEGSTQGETFWSLTTTGPLTPDSSDLTFELDTLECNRPGGPVCTDAETGLIEGDVLPFPQTFATTPPVCGSERGWGYDTTQTRKYRLAVCVGGEGEHPLTEPYVATLQQICIDGTDCRTIPDGADGTLSIITGANLTASIGQTGDVIEVTLNSTGGGSGGSRRMSHHLQLMTVAPGDANAFVATINGTNFPWTAVRFVDHATGCATFKHRISAHLATTPAWTIKVAHKASSGSGGNVVLTIKAKSLVPNEAFDAALSSLITTAVAVNTAANTTLSTIPSTGDFDSEEPLRASELLIVSLCRVGGNDSDTTGISWDLLVPVIEYLEQD